MANPANPVTPEQVGVFYDQMGPFFAQLWGDHIHFGIWHDAEDPATPGEAAVRMTDFMIGKTGMRAGQRFLDVGCGVGAPGIALARHSGATVEGVTVSQSQVEQANANAAAAGLADRARFQLGDAMRLPYADATFDGAWAFESIVHMPSREQVLREMRRVVRPGGQIMVTDIIIRHPIPPEALLMFLGSFSLHSMIPTKDYPPLVAAAGLDLVEILDMTRQTAPILRALHTSFGRNADTMSAIYGPEFVGMMSGALPEIVRIYDTYLGYAIVVAETPAPAAN